MEKENFDNKTVENEDVVNPQAEEAAETVTDESFETTDNSAEKQSEWQDKYMRLSAEFDNYRKRTQKERHELILTAGEDMIRAILPILDDMERAIIAMDGEHKEGVELIYNKFIDILKRRGVVEIEAMQAALDTDFHDAIANIPAPTPESKGKIVDVVQKGYTMNDKVIRFAKVVVGE